MKFPSLKPLLPFFLIFILAAVLRILFLSQYPAGLHYDEAWYGYNAFMIKERATNIYGEKWPVDVDVFGEHVSAAQAYWTVPFITLFGLNAFAIRLTVVTFSLLTLPLAAWLIYRLTKNRTVALVFSVLFAVSPLNIVMARASSTVIIDTFFLLVFLTAMIEWFLRTPDKPRLDKKTVAGLVVVYLTSVVAYVTYFTSRLLIPAFGILTLAYFFFTGVGRKKIAFGALPIILYLFVPFLLLLPTPFARGRFDQTTVLNNPTVKFELANNITRAGQAGLGALPTRILHNKVTENARPLLQQYFTFFSPNPALFTLEFPLRYTMRTLGPITLLEYVGLLLAVALTVLAVTKEKKQRFTTGLFVLLTAVAVIPSALTIDDFPNWQRAAIMTPFLQIAAALGITGLAAQLAPKWSKWLPALLLILSIPTLVLLGENYAVHSKYFEPFHRDAAGWRLGEWINAEAHDDRLLLPSVGVYLFPYFQEQSIIPDLLTSTTDKRFIEAKEFQIGPRHFVRDLCHSPYILLEDYDYLIFSTKDCTGLPWWVESVTTVAWDDNTTAFLIGRAQKEVQESYRQRWNAAKDETEQTMILREALSEEKPSAEERT